MSTSHPIIVTGGNAGIGKAIVHALASQKKHVVIVSRDEQRGLQARDDIVQECGEAHIDVVQGRLDSIERVSTLSRKLSSQYPKIQALINNAGIWMSECKHNEDGLEWTYMVNHLAPFQLTRQLLPNLRAYGHARIVNVNAGLYVNGRYNAERTPYGKNFSALRTYADTKLCNIMFTLALARRLQGTSVTVNAVHPGVIRTGLGQTRGVLGALLNVVKMFWGTPEQGSDAPVWLATSQELEGISGAYFDLRKRKEYAENAQNEAHIAQCWQQSEDFLSSQELH